MADIFDVANYFRWKTDYESGDNMTNLKLQKLCYYALAWHKTFTGNRLFEEEFKAWDHGPLNEELYHYYRSLISKGWDSIPPEDIKEQFDPTEVFELSELESLQEVWDSYGHLGAKHLEQLTHQEDPWLKTSKNNIIPVELMEGYYTQVLANE